MLSPLPFILVAVLPPVLVLALGGRSAFVLAAAALGFGVLAGLERRTVLGLWPGTARPGAMLMLHDTYYVVAHAQYLWGLMAIGGLMAAAQWSKSRWHREDRAATLALAALWLGATWVTLALPALIAGGRAPGGQWYTPEDFSRLSRLSAPAMVMAQIGALGLAAVILGLPLWRGLRRRR